jgi:hypothetical protein
MKDDLSLRYKTKMLEIRVHVSLFWGSLSSFISVLKKETIQNTAKPSIILFKASWWFKTIHSGTNINIYVITCNFLSIFFKQEIMSNYFENNGGTQLTLSMVTSASKTDLCAKIIPFRYRSYFSSVSSRKKCKYPFPSVKTHLGILGTSVCFLALCKHSTWNILSLNSSLLPWLVGVYDF